MTTDNNNDAGLEAGVRRRLLEAARDAALRAHAPYSNFRVGAAVLGRGGRVHTGVNVENASYGLGLCAERAALAAACAAGERDILAVAVACIDADPDAPAEQRMPCGACRQWLLELAPQAEVLVMGVDRVFSVAELLPMGFALD
jgi:cytidine deaminase